MISDLGFKINKQSKGFTLIETLIYIAIISVALMAFANFILAISGSRDKSFAEQEVNANARFTLSLISRKIKSANGINIASSTFDVHPGVLSLSMASSTDNPTIFFLDNGRLTVTEGVGSPRYITSPDISIANLIFTDLTGDSNHGNIGASISFAYSSSTDANYGFAKSLQTAVSLRQ